MKRACLAAWRTAVILGLFSGQATARPVTAHYYHAKPLAVDEYVSLEVVAVGPGKIVAIDAACQDANGDRIKSSIIYKIQSSKPVLVLDWISSPKDTCTISYAVYLNDDEATKRRLRSACPGLACQGIQGFDELRVLAGFDGDFILTGLKEANLDCDDKLCYGTLGTKLDPAIATVTDLGVTPNNRNPLPNHILFLLRRPSVVEVMSGPKGHLKTYFKPLEDFDRMALPMSQSPTDGLKKLESGLDDLKRSLRATSAHRRALEQLLEVGRVAQDAVSGLSIEGSGWRQLLEATRKLITSMQGVSRTLLTQRERELIRAYCKEVAIAAYGVLASISRIEDLEKPICDRY
jgi:hypothetical protein